MKIGFHDNHLGEYIVTPRENPLKFEGFIIPRTEVEEIRQEADYIIGQNLLRFDSVNHEMSYMIVSREYHVEVRHAIIRNEMTTWITFQTHPTQESLYEVCRFTIVFLARIRKLKYPGLYVNTLNIFFPTLIIVNNPNDVEKYT